MEQKDFTRTLRAMEAAKLKLDDHIWSVFYNYIDQEGILFSNPETWDQEGGDIVFLGEDGCMGCYEPMSLEIPIKYFEDSNALEELKLQRVAEKNEVVKKRKSSKGKKRRDEYKRLRKEFDVCL